MRITRLIFTLFNRSLNKANISISKKLCQHLELKQQQQKLVNWLYCTIGPSSFRYLTNCSVTKFSFRVLDGTITNITGVKNY